MTQLGIRALLIVIAAIILLSAIGFAFIKGGEMTKQRAPRPLPSPTTDEVLPPIEAATPTASIEAVPVISEEVTPAPARVATPSARLVQVSIINFAFQPANITTGRGSTIVWLNKDQVVHTVSTVDGSFDSGEIAPGDSFEQRFEKIKVYTYSCTFHPQMRGTITIQ